MNFLRGNDIAFHINPRFNEGGKQVVVRNHKIGESWGAEERDMKGPFPFAPGSPFEVRLERKNLMMLHEQMFSPGLSQKLLITVGGCVLSQPLKKRLLRTTPKRNRCILLCNVERFCSLRHSLGLPFPLPASR